MRLSAPLLTLAGTVAGTAAAVVAYQATAAGSPTKPVSVSTETPAPASSTTWLPCEHGWKLKGKTCVKIEKRVVVVHDLPAPAVAPAMSSGSTPGRSQVSRGGDQAGQDDQNESQDAAENESDDQSQDASEPSDDSGPEDVGSSGN